MGPRGVTVAWSRLRRYVTGPINTCPGSAAAWSLAEATWTRAETTWPLFELGEWDEVIAETDPVVERERSLGGRQGTAIATPMKAPVLLFRRLGEEAAAMQQEFLPMARDIEDQQVCSSRPWELRH